MPSFSDPFILSLAPTGMVPTRAMSPAVPLQPDEIIADVLAAAEVGITMAHLHARDENGRPTYKKDVYARIIGGIRARRPDVILCVSCSGRDGATVEQRAEVLTLQDDLKPDMASLTLASMNFSSGASINAPDTVSELASRMADNGIKPEIEIFDTGMANMLHYLIARKKVQGAVYANLLFGNIATAQARFLDIGAVIAALPPNVIYSLAGLGAAQMPVAAMALAGAPGLRIGLEDNLWLDAGRTMSSSNVSLVTRVHEMAHPLNRRLMQPDELREKLGLPERTATEERQKIAI